MGQVVRREPKIRRNTLRRRRGCPSRPFSNGAHGRVTHGVATGYLVAVLAAAVRPGATGEPAGLARFGFGNAAVRPVAFMTRPEGRPRHSCYRGVSCRRDNRGSPGECRIVSLRDETQEIGPLVRNDVGPEFLPTVDMEPESAEIEIFINDVDVEEVENSSGDESVPIESSDSDSE
ncbi:hypothetical protein Taro_022722 [Colocasia esculenta]|uniref:Uncharacterized protein n=1 Tax=Colocasia esculenta TaxID=4460 RepID=A0A843V4H7_COLES|nr:hypothetical protein [Colocasia esculenta]